MNKLLKLLVAVVVCALAIWAVVRVTAGGGDDVPFKRLKIEDMPPDPGRFRVDKALKKIYFKRGDKETWLEELPTDEGCPFYLKGKQSVQVNPGLEGKVGFYTYLHLDNLGRKRKIHFELEVVRGSTARKVAVIKAAKHSRPFFKELSLKKGDILVCKFRGHGVVFLSRPLVYQKKVASVQDHVFLVGIDTLRADLIGATVKGKPLTPRIDNFAKECAVFDNAFSQSPWTLPSFMSLITGQYEFNHRVDISNPLPAEKRTLVNRLSRRFMTFGLHSGMVMKKRWGFSRGFDYYKKVRHTGALFPRAGQTLFREAVSLLERGDFPGAFFFLQSYQVHDPYTPPGAFLEELYPDSKYKKLDVPNQGAPWKTFMPIADETLRKGFKELYQAEVHAFDAYFGEFIEKLKKLGIYNKATIILMSDHGEEFFEHGGWAHSHSLYNELIKVPAMIKFPGGAFGGTRIKETVGVIDLLPTLLGYYDIPADEDTPGIDGIDLMPLLRGEETKTGRDGLISSIAESRYIRQVPPKFAILSGKYKIVYNYPFTPVDLKFFEPYGLPPQPNEIEVFDLKKDPGETRDIAALKKDVVKRVMPLIIQVKKIIRENLKNKAQKKTGLDEEAKKQLESLGYI